MPETGTLSPSLEDYLEAILQLENLHRVARVKDIADVLGVQMPSVTGALKNLKTRRLVNYSRNSFISLTESGLAAARSVSRRHSVLQAFLEEALALPSDVAESQACGLEHALGPETARRLRNCLNLIKNDVFQGRSLSAAEWRRRVVDKADT